MISTYIYISATKPNMVSFVFLVFIFCVCRWGGGGGSSTSQACQFSFGFFVDSIGCRIVLLFGVRSAVV